MRIFTLPAFFLRYSKSSWLHSNRVGLRKEDFYFYVLVPSAGIYNSDLMYTSSPSIPTLISNSSLPSISLILGWVAAISKAGGSYDCQSQAEHLGWVMEDPRKRRSEKVSSWDATPGLIDLMLDSDVSNSLQDEPPYTRARLLLIKTLSLSLSPGVYQAKK